MWVMPPPQSGCLRPAVFSPQDLKLELALATETDAFRAVDALITMALFRGRKMEGPATEVHIHIPLALAEPAGARLRRVLPSGSIRWQRASVLSASIDRRVATSTALKPASSARAGSQCESSARLAVESAIELEHVELGVRIAHHIDPAPLGIHGDAWAFPTAASIVKGETASSPARAS